MQIRRLWCVVVPLLVPCAVSCCTGNKGGTSASAGLGGSTGSGSATGGASPAVDANGGASHEVDASGGDSSNGDAQGDGSTQGPEAGPPPGVVSFDGDWTADPAKAGWRFIQAVAATKLTLDPANPTPHDKGAARVEVDYGDDPLHLDAGTERAEVLMMQDGGIINEDETSGTQYYGVSFKFPTDWAGTVSPLGFTWSIVFQLHGPDALGASPAFALEAARNTDGGPEIYRVDSEAGDVSTSPYHSYAFSQKADINLGAWSDFIIMITYAKTPTGHITIWRRDEGETAFTQVFDLANVPTLEYDSTQGGTVGPHYWKTGLYRHAVNRTDVHWMGPTVRATTFAAAEWAAFGTANGP